MTTTETEDTKTAMQLAIVIGAMAVVMNVGFYFLADVYYADKKSGQGLLSSITPATVTATRVSFGLFTGLVSGALIAAMFAPRVVGHVLAIGFGLASFVAAIYAVRASMPSALSVALVALSFLFPALAWRSLLGRSRAAWSFLAAICWVLAVTMLFGAPKVRAKMDVGLWTAMIIPGLLFVAGVALTAVRRDYRDSRY